jgi:hypothetical protein
MEAGGGQMKMRMEVHPRGEVGMSKVDQVEVGKQPCRRDLGVLSLKNNKF